MFVFAPSSFFRGRALELERVAGAEDVADGALLRALPPVQDPDPLILGAALGHSVALIIDPACEVHDGVALVRRDNLVGTLVQQQPGHRCDVREHVGGEEEVDGADVQVKDTSRRTPMASYITTAKRSALRAFVGGHTVVAAAAVPGCGVRC